MGTKRSDPATGIAQRYCGLSSRPSLLRKYHNKVSCYLSAGGGSGLQFVKNVTLVKPNKVQCNKTRHAVHDSPLMHCAASHLTCDSFSSSGTDDNDNEVHGDDEVKSTCLVWLTALFETPSEIMYVEML